MVDRSRPTQGSGRLPLSRRTFGAGLVAAGTTALTGLPRVALAAAPTLKIGLLLPRSGYLAQPGQACARAAELAPDILKGMGLSVEITGADTESNTDTARARTEQLISNGAQVIVGAFDSGQTAAAAQVCEQHGVPLVINIAAAPQITEQGYRTVFRNFPTSIALVRNGMALLKDLFAATGATPKTAVFLAANDTFGQANKMAIDKLLPTLDMPFKLVGEISYDPRAQDLSVEVAKAKATGAELVIVTTRANDAIMIVREMVKQRYQPMGIASPGSPGMYDAQFYKTLGKYGDYCITNLPWVDPHSDLTHKVQAAFQKRYPHDSFSDYAFNIGFTFDAILIAADAAHRAGGTDSKALLAALRETNLAEHMMIGPAIRFDAKGQNDDLPSAAVQNRNRKPVVVLPQASAEMKPVFPMPGWSQRT